MSLRDHAGIHAGQPVVVTLDIRRCFPSTNHLRVYKAFQAHFSPSPEIAKLLTRLVTRNYRLPQGAPTSLALSNICLLPLFDQLAAFCEARDLRLSIWCDDIAISGLCAHEFVPTVERIIRVHGHRPNQKKRAIMMNWQEPQLVTGLVVNHGLSRLGDQREAIRAEAIALAKEHQLADNLDRMLGHGSFMTFVSPTQGSRFLRLLERLGAVDTLDRESTG